MVLKINLKCQSPMKCKNNQRKNSGLMETLGSTTGMSVCPRINDSSSVSCPISLERVTHCKKIIFDYLKSTRQYYSRDERPSPYFEGVHRMTNQKDTVLYMVFRGTYTYSRDTICCAWGFRKQKDSCDGIDHQGGECSQRRGFRDWALAHHDDDQTWRRLRRRAHEVGGRPRVHGPREPSGKSFQGGESD